MRVRWLLVALIVLAACTKPNPLNCGDGNCTDPAHPFCDVDGSIEGQPGLCIAVSCTPSEFKECRGNDAIACDTTGANYTVESCQFLCDMDLGGCVDCASSSDCAATTPICDPATHACRQCTADSDCPSLMCDPAGTCHDPATVVYAAPTGSAMAPCGDPTTPCRIDVAFGLVASDTTKNEVKLLPGNYATAATLDTTKTVTVYGSGAILEMNGSTMLTVQDRSTVIVHGLDIAYESDGKAPAIACDNSTITIDSLTMTGDHAQSVGFQVGTGAVGTGCTVAISKASFSGSGRAVIANYSAVTVDRSRFYGSDFGASTGPADNAKLTITNSLIVQPTTSFDAGNIVVQFSTVVNAPQLSCNHVTTVPCPEFDNSIIYASGTTDVAATVGNIRYSYDVLWPQASDPVGGELTDADPSFVNGAMGDYHLKSNSPAIDTADPKAPDTIDLDGTSRPQGPANDIGAYEFH